MQTVTSRTVALILIAGAWILAWSRAALADAQVTLCQIDTQAGSGVNLRDAIATGGKITFACPLQSVISVTQSHNLDDVTEIDGQNKITLDGGNRTSIFVSKGGQHGRSLTLRNLTIQRGKADPGEIVPPGLSGAITIVFNSFNSTFTLDHVTISESERPVYFAFGTFVVTGSQFIDNNGLVLDVGTTVAKAKLSVSKSSFQKNQGPALVTYDADVTIEGVDVQGRSDATERGSVFNGGSVTIRNSKFRNIWGNAQCGGALQSSGRTSIANTYFSGNRSACGGGAVYIWGSAPEAQLSAVTFEDNQSAGRGGAISFDDVDAKITLKFGEFRRNRADFGGALAIDAGPSRHPELHASAVSFKNNVSAQTGAALFVNGAIVQISRGIFVENKPETGGTLSFKGGLTPAFTLGNLLIARNTGAIALDGASGDLVNSTIAENDGVGIQIAGNVRLSNSVIAKNANLNCRFAGSGAVLTNKGSNLQFPDNSCGAAIGSADPLLDSFYVPDPASPLQGAGQDFSLRWSAGFQSGRLWATTSSLSALYRWRRGRRYRSTHSSYWARRRTTSSGRRARARGKRHASARTRNI